MKRRLAVAGGAAFLLTAVLGPLLGLLVLSTGTAGNPPTVCPAIPATFSACLDAGVMFQDAG